MVILGMDYDILYHFCRMVHYRIWFIIYSLWFIVMAILVYHIRSEKMPSFTSLLGTSTAFHRIGAELIIDGVGFPSVGSIVGVDNADVAKAAKAPVLLVCTWSLF